MPPDLKIDFGGHCLCTDCRASGGSGGAAQPLSRMRGTKYTLLKSVTSCSGGWIKHVTRSPSLCQPSELRPLGSGPERLMVKKGGEKPKPSEETPTKRKKNTQNPNYGDQAPTEA